MFVRQKRVKDHTYLQVVENSREDGKPRQRIIATLGRLDQLEETGNLDRILQSAARFSQNLMILSAAEKGEVPIVSVKRIGPPMVFDRLWRGLGLPAVINDLKAKRQFQFDLERVLFTVVLHRLFHHAPHRASDRNAVEWLQDYAIPGLADGDLALQHFYRAMAWLGQPLPRKEQRDATPFGPRTIKDFIEERLFAARRDIFTDLDLVFFDTTSLYFEGEGGETLGQRGHSKDHRPDLKQLVVGVVLDGEGRPVCCEIWPGNTTDVKTLVPVADRLQKRFHISRICLVADRGMISRETLDHLEERGWLYILGARMHTNREVRDEVLSRGGRYEEVHGPREKKDDPSPLKVKEVMIGEHRYVVCLNEDEARKDAADREAIVASLREQLRKGDKSLVGNNGYRKFLRSRGSSFSIDEQKIKDEARFDGKWVLRTNTLMSAAEVALKYKQLWQVEAVFRTTKSLLDTRPIFHQRDATIRGHVFCSFLALMLRTELDARLAEAKRDLSWSKVMSDLDALTITEVAQGRQRFALRSTARGVCGKVFQAVHVALPRTVQRLPDAPSA
ncbi:MAG: IS1634 family transposase [Polyangiaceae bacterium]|nr:IS1634 family transposase [Polyangiaceae bacterium]